MDMCVVAREVIMCVKCQSHVQQLLIKSVSALGLRNRRSALLLLQYMYMMFSLYRSFEFYIFIYVFNVSSYLLLCCYFAGILCIVLCLMC